MVPRATENTVTGIIKDELERRGVKVAQFASVETPVGKREPDLLCQNGGFYPVEAKFTESQILDAIAKVQNDYLKHHRVLGINGGFAILYPKELARPMPVDALRDTALSSIFKLVAMFPPEDPRPFRVQEGRLTDIADALADYVLLPPRPIEPSIPYIIKALRETANYIVAGLRHLSGKSLEEFFGGENVFRNILQYEEGEYPEEDLRLAASYILVNQLLFYHVLSRTRKTQFDVIEPEAIKEPSQLEAYFQKVLDVNYRVVFAFNVANLIPRKFVEEVRKIISVVQGVAPEKVGGDLLGTIFHDLIPFDVRKKVAAFYTNVLAAELLATLAIDKPNAKVADFAVGSGGLLVAAYRRKSELLGRPLTQQDHKRFVEEDLYGVDVMPFAANVAACHLALQAPQFLTDRANVAVWDATDLKPGIKIPSIADIRLVLSGQSTLDSIVRQSKQAKGIVKLREQQGGEEQEIELQLFDVVMMNPPFTRQERIPEDYKTVLVDRFKEEYRGYLHGQLGYHGYFILLADRFLKEGGRMALVLPATVLRVQSFEGIRRLLAEKYNLEYIVTTWHRSAFSESARFREILLLARKTQHNNLSATKVAVLKKLPKGLLEAREIAMRIADSKKDFEDEHIVIKMHDHSRITRDTRNWFRYIATKDLSLSDVLDEVLPEEITIQLTRLMSSLNGEIIRGIETSRGVQVQAMTICHPDRAIKKFDEWIMNMVTERALLAKNRFTQAEIEIPLSAVRRALRRVAQIRKIDITNMTDYVIVDNFEQARQYFRQSIQRVHPPRWSDWREYVEQRMSKLAVVRRGDLSADGTCSLAFYSEHPFAPPGVAWSAKVDDDAAKVLCLWFNSTLSILQLLLERKETRGAFLQLDEYVLEGLKVPDITSVNPHARRLLLDSFEKVRNVPLPSILEQLKTGHEARRAIDLAWLGVLGYKGDREKLLARLYASLSEEVELLRRLMAEGQDYGE